jgi:gamma-glutamyl-gamma-aminobutyrate hydrolase PuuD
MGVQKLEKKCKKKITSNKRKHKIIITGDSHTRDCASEVKQIVHNTFKVQGVVKLGSGLMTITKSAEDDTNETDKNRHGGSAGRHKGRGKK